MKLPNLKVAQDFLARLSKKERTILCVAAVCICLALFDRLILYPISSRISSLNDQTVATEANIRKNARILALKDRILAESAKYSSYSRVSGSDEEEMTSLLKEIEQIAGKCSVYLIDIKPSGIKEVSGSKRYNVSLNCEGEMEHIASFMLAMESSSKLLTVEKYQISPKSKDADAVKCSMFVSKIVVP